MSTVPLALHAQLSGWPDTTSALYAGTVLLIAPLLAAIASAPGLTELGHWAAVCFGIAMLAYGSVGMVRSGISRQASKAHSHRERCHGIRRSLPALVAFRERARR